MGDFPRQWEWVRDLPEGGQGYNFVVRRSDGPDSDLFVLKRLKNPKREGYFEREIQAGTTLNHPNVLRVLEHGHTPKGRPFLITEYCPGGSLEKCHRFESPLDGLRFFQQIVAGVGHAHAHEPPIYHLDLKPENILLKDGAPVVADFGICFIEDNEVSLTKEGPRGSMYYCAPELRGPKIAGNLQPAAADMYSLGKVLYWLFTREVYEGHEEDYGDLPSRRLAHLFPAFPQFAFVDELVAQMVRRNPAQRIANANDLRDRLQDVADRVEARGHVLDPRVPQRCLYCAAGRYHVACYRASHDQVYVPAFPQEGDPGFPDIERREAPDAEPSIYATLRAAARALFGGTHPSTGAPLFLVCDYCGNIQYFRLDLTQDGYGKNWRP